VGEKLVVVGPIDLTRHSKLYVTCWYFALLACCCVTGFVLHSPGP